ncbi:MAG: response regulator [Alphaproteobacteria bacterium]|nr:response regulator [Alphaproteobacteria bacterium]
MEILSINADQKLISIASSIGRDPQSWAGWFCLEFLLYDVDDDIYQECMLWTKSVVESYLQDTEGRVYCCSDRTIHVIAKISSCKILHHTARHICDLIQGESGIEIPYTVYDLVENGFSYAQNVLSQVDNVLELPKPLVAELERSNIPEQSEHLLSSLAHNTRVLLVEDDPVTRWMVRNALKYECEFVTAPTANKAFSLYSSYQPDVVFLDINLPDGNGYTVLEWILRNDPGAQVIMFSSNDNLDNIQGALEEGACGFIAKPFLKEQLMRYVQKH